MRIARTHAELSAALRATPAAVGFVPTMGALHEGHASLIDAARKHDAGACIVVSIFVNPTQFGPKEDFSRYPRTFDADVAICREHGCDVVYAPAVEDVYPPGAEIPTPPLPGVATQPRLEDAHRPGHFAGVCQVVQRLFDLVSPAFAVFGEKDWQQLAVIRAMVAAGGAGPVIIPGATLREHDGLAMSSRNRFLSLEERLRAGALYRGLLAAGAAETAAAAEALLARELYDAGIEVNYAVVRDAATLLPVDPELGRDRAAAGPGSYRALVAGKLGSVRLLDNAAWPLDPSDLQAPVM